MSPPTLVLVAIALSRVSDFLADVGARITALFRTEPEMYVARHRKDGHFTPYIHWADKQRANVMHWIAVHAQPVMAEPLVPELQLDDTQSMILPDFTEDDPQTDLTHPDQSAGSSHYLKLRPVPMEVHHMKFVRTHFYPVRLRGAAPAFGDIDNEAYAEAMAG